MIPAIPDDTFVRGDVPMTKEEVRSIRLLNLRLRRMQLYMMSEQEQALFP